MKNDDENDLTINKDIAFRGDITLDSGNVLVFNMCIFDSRGMGSLFWKGGTHGEDGESLIRRHRSCSFMSSSRTAVRGNARGAGKE